MTVQMTHWDAVAYKVKCLKSFEKFVEYFFEWRHNVPFTFAPFHHKICERLDAVVRGELKKLIINVPPRYGKTELISKMFVAYGFAINPASKFVQLSYSKSLAEENSSDVKDTLNSPQFQKMFDARISGKRKNTRNEWYTIQGGGLYVAPFRGQITGFGAGTTETEKAEYDDAIDTAKLDEYTVDIAGGDFGGALVIDDPLKALDAESDIERSRVNELFENTIRSRVNSRNTPIIIVMQRLHERDLCGYLQDIEPDEWSVLCLPAISFENGEERALWPLKHTLEELHKMEERAPFVFETQYQQNPTPKEGLMYTVFRTYDTLPVGRYVVKNYTDTADKGADYCVSVDYAEFEGTGECYILDVVCTDKAMEYTEPEVARMIDRDKVSVANIESNNGGRGFARNVERNLRIMGNSKTRIVWFTQTLNKEARILTHSAEVQNLIFYPSDWKQRFAQFHAFATSYRKKGRNAHDDVPDVLTGIVEKRATPVGRTVHVGRHTNF